MFKRQSNPLEKIVGHSFTYATVLSQTITDRNAPNNRKPEKRKEVYPTGFEHRFLEPDCVTLKLVFLWFGFFFLVCVCGYGKVHLCASLSFLITLRCLPCIGLRKCEINVKH